MPLPWLTKLKVCPARSGCVPTLREAWHLLGIGSWRLADRYLELRAGRHLTRSLDSIAFVSSRSPPVFSPQVRGTERYRLSVGLLHYIRLLLQRVPIGRPCWVLQSPFGSQTWRSARRQAFTPLYPWEPDLGWVPYVWPYGIPYVLFHGLLLNKPVSFPLGEPTSRQVGVTPVLPYVVQPYRASPSVLLHITPGGRMWLRSVPFQGKVRFPSVIQ